jgi:hypothetical protein
VQITLTTPLRRMILQLRQIFFTDASTFIFTPFRLSAVAFQLSAKPLNHDALPLLTAD